jgi:hypothetical protein
MPQVGFETTIPEFERAKTVHALDHAATVSGYLKIYHVKFQINAVEVLIFCLLHILVSLFMGYIEKSIYGPAKLG